MIIHTLHVYGQGVRGGTCSRLLTRLVSSTTPTSSEALSDPPPDPVLVKDNINAFVQKSIHSYDIKVRNEILTDDKSKDITRLIHQFTAPALATALRDREITLATCAYLLQNKQFHELETILKPFFEGSSYQVRNWKKYTTNAGAMDGSSSNADNNTYIYVNGGVNTTASAHIDSSIPESWSPKLLIDIRARLRRIPRFLTKETELRASVVMPLCHNKGVPSILFTTRTEKVSRHKGQICFPGGMVDDTDLSINDTALRELDEELGISSDRVEVLGVLRCDWSEVASLTGISVTPIIGYIGEVSNLNVKPNLDEVDSYFTVPIKSLLDEANWQMRQYSAPVYTSSASLPNGQAVWGLTGYILQRFLSKALKPALNIQDYDYKDHLV